MRKLLRGTQAMKQKAGVSQGTTDDSYDELEKEITKLQKTAKELPKVISGLQDGMKSMWKAYSKMSGELQKVSSTLQLSPLATELSRQLEIIGSGFEAGKLEKLGEDLNGSAIDVLRKLEADIKSLDHIREERGKRRLEYDAVREKMQKKEAELQKKGKDIESDRTILARRIDVETALKAYEVSNSRSIEEMTKVTCVKDDVMKMTTYNIAAFMGEYMKSAGEMLLSVKSMYESAANGTTPVYRKESKEDSSSLSSPVDSPAVEAGSGGHGPVLPQSHPPQAPSSPVASNVPVPVGAVTVTSHADPHTSPSSASVPAVVPPALATCPPSLNTTPPEPPSSPAQAQPAVGIMSYGASASVSLEAAPPSSPPQATIAESRVEEKATAATEQAEAKDAMPTVHAAQPPAVEASAEVLTDAEVQKEAEVQEVQKEAEVTEAEVQEVQKEAEVTEVQASAGTSDGKAAAEAEETTEVANTEETVSAPTATTEPETTKTTEAAEPAAKEEHPAVPAGQEGD